MTPPAASIKPLTVVTVVYTVEINLMLLQARSLARFLDPALVKDIIVIVHDTRPKSLARLCRLYILPAYGRLAKYVRIISADDISPVKARNWKSQQVMKLVIAKHVTTDWYLTLDTKNHLVRPVTADTLFAPDGRPRNYLSPVDDRMYERFDRCQVLMDLPCEERGTRVLPTITPYMLNTGLVRDMIRFIEESFGDVFDTFFMKEKPVNEYYLYYNFLRKRNIPVEDLYFIGRVYCVTFFKMSPTQGRHFETLIERAFSENTYAFAVHRKCLENLADTLREKAVQMWVERGLTADAEEAVRFLEPAFLAAKPTMTDGIRNWFIRLSGHQPPGWTRLPQKTA